MFETIPPTAFDLRFSLFRIPARVHPGFWLIAAIFGYELLRRPVYGPAYFFVWVGVVLISITVHEYGHALTAQRYGFHPHVILYWFGGLAIYQADYRFDMKRSIAISFMGPGAGFLLYGLIVGIEHLLLENGVAFHPVLAMFFLQMKFVNLWWGLLNLIPVLPLDGGRILEAILIRYRRRDGQLLAIKAGILIGAAVGLALLLLRDQLGISWFPGILFLVLAFGNFQTLQAYQRGGY